MTDKDYYNGLWEESPMGRAGCGSPLLATIVLGLIILLSSCATPTKIEYVDREIVKYEVKVQHDTLTNNVHDSIHIAQKGDTVFVDRWHSVVREKIVSRADTCWRDSIQTVIVNKTVEKQIIPKWCRYCLAVCVLFLIFAITKVVRWWKNL